MAKYDQGGGCSCGLNRYCDCGMDKRNVEPKIWALEPKLVKPEKGKYDVAIANVAKAKQELESAKIKLASAEKYLLSLIG